MLPTLTASPPRGKHRNSVPPLRRRHDRLRSCPRCAQWRSQTQFPASTEWCGACTQAIARQAERSQGRAERRRPVRGQELIVEVEWLIRGGEPANAIQRAVRAPSVTALQRTLYRLQRGDLARALEVRAPQ